MVVAHACHPPLRASVSTWEGLICRFSYVDVWVQLEMSLRDLWHKTYNLWFRHLKALVFLYAFEESVDCHLLSSFCDDSNLRISLVKYVLSTMGVSKESISKYLIGNRFHVKLRILSPENCKQSLQVKSWKAEVTAEKKQTQDYN